MHFKQPCKLVVSLAIMVWACGPAPATGDPIDFAMAIDLSLSMRERGRLEAAKQALSLACMILAGRVQILGFSDRAVSSPPFDLKHERKLALGYIDRLQLMGGTVYRSVIEDLQRLNPKSACFVTDGEPQDPADHILELMGKSRFPVHTIGIQTDAGARALLVRMAAASKNAGFHPVDDPAKLVDVFLEMLSTVRPYRRFDSTADVLDLSDVEGEVLAIGFDAVPELPGGDPANVDLAGRRIHVARAVISPRRSIQIPVQGPSGSRTVIIRFDQPRAELHLSKPVMRGNQAVVQAAVEFRDASGNLLDANGMAGLSAVFEVLGTDGSVMGRFIGKPNEKAATMGAAIKLQAKPGAQTPFVIRGISTDSSTGQPFIAANSVAFVLDPATAQKKPAVTATTAMQITCGQPGAFPRFTWTVNAEGAADECREFLDTLAQKPPAVTINAPGRGITDTVSAPANFTVAPKLINDRTLSMEVTSKQPTEPGEYLAQVAAGAAGEVDYPAAQARARCLHPSSLKFQVVAHRKTMDKQVVYDSEDAKPDNDGRYAIDGDDITLELLRGPDIEVREFASLGINLNARIITPEGTAKQVPLTLNNDSYSTKAFKVRGPGTIQINVEIGGGLDFRHVAQVQIEKVRFRIEPGGALVRPPAFWLCGANLRLEVALSATVRGRPAPAAVCREIVQRDGLYLRWTLTDSSGAAYGTEKHVPDQQPWKPTIYLSQCGQAALVLELLDSQGTLLDGMRWEMNVVEAPVELRVYTLNSDGSLSPTEQTGASWLPGFLRWSPPCFVVARPSKSAALAVYCLADVSVNGVKADFEQSDGSFRREVTKSGPVQCVSTLKPYAWQSGVPELRLSRQLDVHIPSYPRWSWLAGVVVGLGVSAGLLGVVLSRSAAWFVRRRLQALDRFIELAGLPDAPVAMVQPGPATKWPCREVVLCKTGDEDIDLKLFHPADAGTYPPLARLVLNFDGTVTGTVESNVPPNQKGERFQLDLTNGQNTKPWNDCSMLLLTSTRV